MSFAQFAEGRGLVEESPGDAPTPVDVPPASPAELRFVGGAQQLCQRLAGRLPAGSVALATSVTALSADGGGLTATTVGPGGAAGRVESSFAVVAVPPRLALERIAFTPALAPDVARVMKATTTWMARAVKCVAVYDTPFWRDAGWSGFAFSHVGPLREVHDACTADGSVAALWGFLAGDDDVRSIAPGERARSVFAQLERLFGPPAGDPVQYFERDWSADPNTIDDEWYWVEGEPLDHGHPAMAQRLLGGRVVLAGAETAAIGGGHMEGAVRSGHRAATEILRSSGALQPP
ncbi:MAG: flavin monoamine oxidase family protein [Acidimicrobiales bacterium]